jgi:hypothetical protein
MRTLTKKEISAMLLNLIDDVQRHAHDLPAEDIVFLAEVVSPKAGAIKEAYENGVKSAFKVDEFLASFKINT